jgi:serine/alanine adding enzyme
MASYRVGFVGKRAVMHHYPVISDEKGEQILSQIISGLKTDLAQLVLYVELRLLKTSDTRSALFASQGFVKRDRINLIVNLAEENLFNRLSESKRRQVRKAHESGVVTSAAGSVAEVYDFYAILKKHYRHKVRKPIPHVSFFLSVFHNGNNNVKLLITRVNNTVVGGVVVAGSPGKTYYEWYIAGDHKKYNHLYPSVVSTWSAIEYAATQKGIKFDFMGGGIPDVPYGVRDFKEKFGSRKEINIRFLYTAHPLLFSLIKNAFKWLGL